MSKAQLAKDEYEAAIRKFNKSTYFALYITLGFILLSTFGYMLISINRSSIFFVAKSDLTQPGTKHQILLLLGIGLYIFVSLILPVTCLFYYDNRLRRNPRLHCPLCDAFLGMEHISALIIKTGMCHQCKEMLFEGAFTSKEEAHRYYYQLEVNENQKTKSEMEGITRFTFIVSILTIIPSLLIYVWMAKIKESMGEAVPSVFGYLVFFLIFPPIFWFLSRISLKECERRDEELRKTAHEMNFHNLKTEDKN